MIRPPSRNRAFTLLEVILAISLAIGIVLAVTGFYNQVVRIRSSIMDDVQMASSQRRVMDRLTGELRGAMVYPFLQMGLQGQSEQVRMITAVVPGAGVWRKKDITENPPPPEQDIQMVVYRLRYLTDDDGRTVTDEQGQPIVLGLERTCQKYFAPAAEEGKEIAVDFITPYVKFLRLQYWDGTAWSEGWGGQDLPLAVEVTLGRDPLPAGMTPDQYPFDVQRRVIYMPGGGKALSVAPATGGTP